MDRKQDEPRLSLNDFKKWMTGQNDQPAAKARDAHLIGLRVESKLGTKRLLHKIDPAEGDLEEVARDFRKNGGIVLEVADLAFLVEVDSGTFYIPRFFVRKA